MATPAPEYVTSPQFERMPWLVHGFGTAKLKEEDFASAPVLRDFRLVIMRQVHSDVIYNLDSPPVSKLSGDGLTTSVPGLLLVVRTADCLPVLLVDEQRRAVAAVHCGWRGTRKRILEKAVHAMSQAYGSKSGELLAALGPCIGPACYEVGPEVREEFERTGFPESIFTPFPYPSKKEPERKKAGKKALTTGDSNAEKWLLDLRGANVWLLEGAGVKIANIWNVESCTHCDPALLSYRRNKGEPHRLYNFIGLRP